MTHAARERGEEEWREQMDLKPESRGARVLVCACTPLPGDEHAENDAERQGGYVIVFDDISALLQAQRDAAWGEVARRLAHEIKNPLTPIQLSAERMRRRYLAQMKGEDAQILDRATYTIVQQVEAMKAMVNAFSEYARAPDMKVTRFPLQRAGHRGRRPAPRAGIGRDKSMSSWIRASSRSRPTVAACARSSTT